MNRQIRLSTEDLEWYRDYEPGVLSQHRHPSATTVQKHLNGTKPGKAMRAFFFLREAYAAH